MTTLQNKKSISWSSFMTVKEHRVRGKANERWYQQDELKEIHKEILETTRSVNKSCFCLRGLETLTDPEIKRSRIMRRRIATNTVLDEQQDQYEQGLHSPEFIAELYQEISRLSNEDAHARAMEDQRAAVKIHHEQRKPRMLRNKQIFHQVMRGAPGA